MRSRRASHGNARPLNCGVRRHVEVGDPMSDSDIESDRLKRLRDSMTQAEIDNLKARFDSQPDSLSRDEIAVLYLVTRERIAVFESKARKRNEEGGSRQ